MTTTVGTRTALTITGLATLAAGTFLASSAYDLTVTDPDDLLVEVSVYTTNSPTGNKQVVVYAQASLDGTVFESGPTSGSSAVDEPNLRFLGVVPMNTTSVLQTRIFSLAASFGGVLPKQAKIVVKNDCGVALTTGAGGTINTSEVVLT